MHTPEREPAERQFPKPQEISSSHHFKPVGMSWFKRHKKLVIILSIIVVILIGGGVATALYFMNRPAPEPVKTAQVKKPVEKPKPVYYSTLTGTKVETEALQTAPVTGVMIENSPDARPQSGLKNSGVVYEAIAEGGITRFLVLYQSEKPQLIGPVRSVRLYDVEWIKPYNAGLAHVGGSAEALSEVRNGTYRDLDQFFNGAYYWRSTDRFAPHNVYTSFEKLDALNAARGYTSSTFTGFPRKDSKASKEPTATSISVTISSALYNSTYAYNATSNTYDRSQAGAPHLDREDGQISPRVVIVMKVNEQTVLQDGYREDIITVGQGQASIFQDGEEIEATWRRASTSDQISFTDAEGNEIKLARGQTWLTAIPADTGAVSWQ